ncbi:inverse autotransporter beta domain-containing protein, partial [Aeromonas veronii]|uniref:inverse autotransporter beta domain-containing protein n=1 Tax=Aeromonas veronii TaxID=654 RepID=UPI0040559106
MGNNSPFLVRNLMTKLYVDTSDFGQYTTRSYRVITWFVIFFQLFTPLGFVFPAVASAAQLSDNTNNTSKQTPPSGNELPDLGSSKNEKSNNEKNEPGLISENTLAQNLMLASDLSNTRDSSDKKVASGLVSSNAQQVAENVFNQYGTARVQLNLDDNFHSGESSLDFLLPVIDDKDFVLFSQTGWRNKNSRNTINLGAGVRLFHDDWMTGINAFYDNDSTGNNRRIGVGGELWANYLKFSGNIYNRLSNWHQSLELADYNERPANGWDIRTEGWLPAYPQIGGKLVYEQYYGDEVGLFSSNDRKKDPNAITTGITWTPVPLFTLGTDFRHGSSNNDLSFNAQFNWRLGEPLSKQLSPDSVGQMRSLAENRLALVERNNNIVLEYQKQEVIKISLPPIYTGNSSEVIPVSVSVTAKYGLASLDWSAPDFVAAGGKTFDKGGEWFIQLPSFKEGMSNQYILTVTATDRKGNHSRPAETLVVVNKADSANLIASYDASSASLSLPADPQSQKDIQLVIKDQNGNPVTGLASRISFYVTALAAGPTASRSWLEELYNSVLPKAYAASGDASTINVSVTGEVAPGVYSVNVIAGTATGKFRITTLVDSTPVGSQISLTVYPNVDVSASSFTSDKTELLADGSDSLILSAKLIDNTGAAVSGKNVSFVLSGTGASGASLSPVTEANGFFSSVLKASQGGSITAGVMLDGTPTGIPSVTVIAYKAQPLVKPANISVQYGSPTQQLTIGGGNGGVLSYASTDDAVVSVDSSGLMTFNAVGTATITVSESASGHYPAQIISFDVTVMPGTGTALAVSDVTAIFGDAAMMAAATGGNGGPLTYSSSAASVVTVDNSGLLTFTGVGTATVTVTEAASGNYVSQRATFTVTVTKATGTALVVPGDVIVTFGDAPVAAATGGNGGPLTYSSSNTSVVTVDNSGLLTFTGVGTATVTVTEAETANLAGQSKTFIVTVRPASGSGLVVSANVTKTFGDAPVTAAATGGNGGTLSYRSSNTGVVTVDNSGLLTFTGAGTATITVTETSANYTAQKATFTVTVNKAAGTALVAPADVTATLGDSPAAAAVTGGNGGLLSYRSSNAGVVTVDNSGLLTFTGAGTATITVTETSANYAAQSTTFTVTVNQAAGTALVAPADVTVNFGEAPVTAAATGGNGGTLSYSSSAASVVTVNSSGRMTFMGAGTATITVTEAASGNYASQSKTFRVTVNPTS